MAPRTDLHILLKSILGSEAVYFQPPSSDKIVYPCIVYQRDKADTKFADNNPYHYEKEYQLTVIDRDPDSIIPDEIAKLPKCVFSTHFTVDNLNHDVFTIFF
jgi:hypothetical protein